MRDSEPLKLFEAFAGYGSQALALKRYGVSYEHVGYSEICPNAIKAHKALHGEVKNYGDISRLKISDLPEIDIFTYSFPCQDISKAGEQKGFAQGSGTRSSLLWECERAIEGKLPKVLMLENVKALINKKNKPHFLRWLGVLNDLGYNNYWKVINARYCGVPQNRERLFCVSIRADVDEGLFYFEGDFDNGARLKNVLESEVDEKYYLSEKAIARLLNIGGSGFKSTVKIGEDIAATLLAVDHKLPRSMNIIRRNSRLTRLSPKESFRLMGLTDMQINRIQATGLSDTSQYRLAGNSIVVACMKFLKNLNLGEGIL